MIYEPVLKRKEESSYSPGEILKANTGERPPAKVTAIAALGREKPSFTASSLPFHVWTDLAGAPDRKYNAWEMEKVTEAISPARA